MTTIASINESSGPRGTEEVPVTEPCEASAAATMAFQQTLAEQLASNAALGDELRAAMVSVSETLGDLSEGDVPKTETEAPETLETSETSETPETLETPEATADALVAAGAAPSAVSPSATVETPSSVTVVMPADVVRMQATEAVSSAVLVQTAEAVADKLLVTPGLLSGQGEVLVQLKPDVLDGTEVRIAVTGRQLDVVFQPQTVDMAVMIENCRSVLVQHLAAKIVSFNVAVDVRKKRESV